MLHQKNSTLVSTPEVQHLVQTWVQQRQEVLVHYSELCLNKDEPSEKLQQFCQILMDYLSAGHFRLFEKLTEFHQPLNSELMSKILSSTEDALDFNDLYTDPKSFDNLSTDLSELGVNLANRIDWEDELIQHCLQFSN